MPDSDRHIRERDFPDQGCRDLPRDPSGPIDVPPFQAVLALLTFLFAVRIVAPLLAAYFDLSFLPSFESWHSATMPYPVLFGFQAIILAAMVGGMGLVQNDKPRPKLGRALIWFGSVYILAMVARLAIGALGLTQSNWFEGAVPSSFHFVLGAYVLTLGVALRPHAQSDLFGENVRRAVRVCAYPGLMIGGFTLFVWLRQTGSPLLFSSYLSVLVAAIGIVLHETLFPAYSSL
jgi:hypothetical protein